MIIYEDSKNKAVDCKFCKKALRLIDKSFPCILYYIIEKTLLLKTPKKFLKNRRFSSNIRYYIE